MPVYNCAVFLPQTLISVEEQTYSNWELIFIDDGSVDDSVEIIKYFCERHSNNASLFYSSHPQSGAAVCRNIGIEKCIGKYVIFLDSDDLLEPFCLQQRVSIMEQNPNLSWAIFNQYEWRNLVSKPLPIFNKSIRSKEEAIGHFLSFDPPWAVTSPIWIKKYLQKLDGFDPSFIYMEDPDLHLRALLYSDANYLICNDSPPDCLYRLGDMNSSKESIFYKNSIDYRLKFLTKYIISDNEHSSLFRTYYSQVRSGFILFIKQFVLSRIDMFHFEILASIEKLSEKKVLSRADVWKLKFLINLFRKDNLFIKLFRIKGIAYRLML
jgi:glycosyltransferase involved in cell wall biosynthesis